MKKITASIAIVLGLIFFVVFTGYRSKAISSEFTEHVSIYPGAMIISSEKLPAGNNLTLDVNDTVDEIYKYYMTEMTKNGWTVLSCRDNFIAFSKDDKGVMIDLTKILKKKSQVTISYLKQV